jgi:hypothetical protein
VPKKKKEIYPKMTIFENFPFKPRMRQVCFGSFLQDREEAVLPSLL